jgi:hypothetical protein
MAHDKNVSPVGWYFGSYVLRFAELSDEHRNDPERKFLTWENTVLVRASNLDEAYEKVAKIGREGSKPYRGGPEGVRMRWHFEGVTQLLPIYEDLEDGAEIAWTDHGMRKLKNTRKWTHPKGSFRG